MFICLSSYRKRQRTSRFTEAFILLSLLTTLRGVGLADEEIGVVQVGRLPIQDFLNQHCTDCHNQDSAEGGVLLEGIQTLDPKVLAWDSGANRDLAARTLARGRLRSSSELLERVQKAVQDEDMPPENSSELSRRDRERFLDALDQHLVNLSETARGLSSESHRRLTRSEYNYTMQELFGVEATFDDMLPPDPISPRGYSNDRELLNVSSIQVEAYFESARRAISRYLQVGTHGQEHLNYHIEFEDLFYAADKRYETRANAPEPVDSAEFARRKHRNELNSPSYTDPLSPAKPGAYSEDEKLRAAIPKLHQQYVAIPKRFAIGELVLRIKAAGTEDRLGRYPRMRVEAGITLGDGCSMNKRLLGEVDVTARPDSPEYYEFRIRLEDVPTKGPVREEESFDRLSLFDMDQIFISNISTDERAIFGLGRGGFKSPEEGSKKIAPLLERMSKADVNFLHLDCIEIEMHKGLGKENGDCKWKIPAPFAFGEQTEDERFLVVQKILTEFMQTAYRRPIQKQEVDRKISLIRRLQADGMELEDCLKEACAATLISPAFLFLPTSESPTEKTADYELASQLSYAIWLSPPDERLLKLAAKGGLRERRVLHGEVRRMISDPKINRFLDAFARQWLRLDRIKNVQVSRDAFPEYDHDMVGLMESESLAFFKHVFHSEQSALDLLSADYALLNSRLANHYGLGGVSHGELRKVFLPTDSDRGGLLSQASLLTMNADGKNSHPIRRGVWVLDRMLNQPPPPPPPNVPELEESGTGSEELSLSQRLALHRESDACSSCHDRIDPWGLGLESFDAIGQFRGNSSAGEDAATIELPDGSAVRGVRRLQRYLRSNYSQEFAKAITCHMMTFVYGRRLDYLDRPEVDRISKQFSDANFSLKTLVELICTSHQFSNAN